MTITEEWPICLSILLEKVNRIQMHVLFLRYDVARRFGVALTWHGDIRPARRLLCCTATLHLRWHWSLRRFWSPTHVPTAIGWLCTAISFSVYESTAKRTKIYAPNHNTQRRNEQIKTWYLQFVGMDLRGRIYDICRRHWLEFRLWFPWSK